MDTLYESEFTSDEQRCHLCFALAKAHRDLENLKMSFILPQRRQRPAQESCYHMIFQKTKSYFTEIKKQACH